MGGNQNARFTIGQFAALHDINKKTLMWYDEIGLLKPAAIDPENGYRYYTYRQTQALETILMLRELNVPLPQIQAFMNSRSASSLETLLEENIRQVDQTIAHLRAVRRVLSQRHQEMLDLLNLDLDAIQLIHRERRYLAVVPLEAGFTFDQEVELMMDQARRCQLRRLHDAAYGSMISVETLAQGRFQDYDAMFLELPAPVRRRGLHIQPKGTYLRAYSRGSLEAPLAARYREILDYAAVQGWTLTGCAYETCLNELVVDSPEEDILQIDIPVLSGNKVDRQPPTPPAVFPTCHGAS